VPRTAGSRPRPAVAAFATLVAVGVSILAPTTPVTADERAPDDAERPDAHHARAQPDLEPQEPGAQDADGRAAVETEVLAEIDEVLGEIGDALSAGDPDALRPVLADPEEPVGERWLDRARHLGGVPLDGYVLRIDERLGDLTTDRVRGAHDDQVRVVAVLEEHTLAGQDGDGPARHRHTLTFVDDDGWRLADDQGGRRLGRSEPTHLWDLGPVTTTEQGPVLALHHPDAPGVSDLVAETADAVRRLRDRWPAPWREEVALIVPRDSEELTELLDVGIDLDDFLAFLSATTHSGPGGFELTGPRLVVNPDRFPDRPDLRERVLLHELVHVATRPVASPWMPLWLEEGVAQALGEQGPSTGHTSQLDAAGAAGRRLPTDSEFIAEGREATLLAYQRSFSFVDHLVGRLGAQAVVDFYVAVGEAATGPGTRARQVDDVARAELGADLDALVSDWRAAG
jgi:hypothetical protein